MKTCSSKIDIEHMNKCAADFEYFVNQYFPRSSVEEVKEALKRLSESGISSARAGKKLQQADLILKMQQSRRVGRYAQQHKKKKKKPLPKHPFDKFIEKPKFK